MKDAQACGCASREEYKALRRAELERAMEQARLSPAALCNLAVSDQDAARHLPSLARELAARCAARGIDIVFTHPYEGGHPDHDATAFAVHAAAALGRRAGRGAPEIVEMAFYHQGRDGPVMQRFHPGPTEEIAVALDTQSSARKQAMIECHASQRRTLAPFRSPVERFRLAPSYDFTAPAAPCLYYESFDWGLTGEEWIDFARTALRDLDLPAVL